MNKIPSDGWEKPVINRRSGPDYIKLADFWVGIICWIVFTISIVVIFKSMPEDHTILSRVRGTSVRSYWDLNLLQYN